MEDESELRHLMYSSSFSESCSSASSWAAPPLLLLAPAPASFFAKSFLQPRLLTTALTITAATSTPCHFLNDEPALRIHSSEAVEDCGWQDRPLPCGLGSGKPKRRTSCERRPNGSWPSRRSAFSASFSWWS